MTFEIVSKTIKIKGSEYFISGIKNSSYKFTPQLLSLRKTILKSLMVQGVPLVNEPGISITI